MNLPLTLLYSLALSAVASAAAGDGSRRLGRLNRRTDTSSDDKGDFTAIHEVHQYEQVKFEDEPEWACKEVEVAGQIGCIKCWNPRPAGAEALIVEVKAMYKRAEFNVKNETVNEPRKHCIFPKRGPFYTCFNSNLVIEPDTSWLGSIKDKPIYDSDGKKVSDGNSGGQCYPGDKIPDAPDSNFF